MDWMAYIWKEQKCLPGPSVVANKIDGRHSNITRTSNIFNNLLSLLFNVFKRGKYWSGREPDWCSNKKKRSRLQLSVTLCLCSHTIPLPLTYIFSSRFYGFFPSSTSSSSFCLLVQLGLPIIIFCALCCILLYIYWLQASLRIYLLYLAYFLLSLRLHLAAISIAPYIGIYIYMDE